MDDVTRWREINEQHLAAALTLLRLRLTAHLETAGRPAPPAMPGGLGPGHDPVETSAAAEAMAEAEAAEVPPALVILARRFGLSSFERDVLLLCAATELDTRIAPLCALVQDDPDRPYPTFALALAVFEEPAWDVLSLRRPLRHWRLIEAGGPTGLQPLVAAPLRIDERVIHFLKGLNDLDPRLSPLLMPLDGAEAPEELPRAQRASVERIVRHLGHDDGTRRPPVIHLSGPDALSKRSLARLAAAAMGLQAYRLPAALLPSQAVDLDSLARLWRRESVLLPVALYLDAHTIEPPHTAESLAAAIDRFLERVGGVVFLDAGDLAPSTARATLTIDVVRPEPDEQHECWAAELGPSAADSPGLLAGQFDLDLATIRRVARTMLGSGDAGPLTLHDRLWDACLASTRPRLDGLALPVDARASWDDLVLPAAEREALRRIADQGRWRGTVYETWGFRRKTSRGLGITALFAGESGTGKTMAAEVLARDLRLDLYRIDLSAVVSKYIGETEKNLRRLFDAAQDGGALLFFDEADALFGRRSEVKESHDRYANIEINYLLQRLESYRGLAVLATNMKGALDPAFLRRLRFVVNFPFPGPAERLAIWRNAFPARTPTAGLDFDRLARLNLTGGSIHNVALNAAFLAARAGTAVTMTLALDAARAEYHKLERPVSEAEFRWSAEAYLVP